MNKQASECRYTIESDTPDGGKSVYPECFGCGGLRGIVIIGSDSLSTIMRHWYGLMGGSDRGYYHKKHYPETEATRGNYWVCDRGEVLDQAGLFSPGHNETPFLPAFDDAGQVVA